MPTEVTLAASPIERDDEPAAVKPCVLRPAARREVSSPTEMPVPTEMPAPTSPADDPIEEIFRERPAANVDSPKKDKAREMLRPDTSDEYRKVLLFFLLVFWHQGPKEAKPPKDQKRRSRPSDSFQC